MKTDRNKELENKAKEYADKHERRGCSYWNGLYRGYFDALKKQEKLKESLKMQVAFNDELLLTLKEQTKVIMEFVEWIGRNADIMLEFEESNKKWIKARPYDNYSVSTEYDEYTTEELYNYWLENIKK